MVLIRLSRDYRTVPSSKDFFCSQVDTMDCGGSLYSWLHGISPGHPLSSAAYIFSHLEKISHKYVSLSSNDNSLDEQSNVRNNGHAIHHTRDIFYVRRMRLYHYTDIEFTVPLYTSFERSIFCLSSAGINFTSLAFSSVKM